MQNIFYVNGRYIPENEANINVTDLGLLRGFGVFDFFRAIDGKVLFLDDHLDRLEYSTAKFQLEMPHSRVKLKAIISELIQQNEAKLLGIKIIVTGGYSADGYSPTKPNFIIVAKPFTFFDKPSGMHLMSLEYLRELPDIKSLNYMVPIFHRPQMLAMRADDYLYHKNGLVSELSRSNIFIVKNEKIITPNANILHGITRKYMLKITKNNWEVEERDVKLTEALEADELFTTGSTKKVTAITKIDQKPISKGKIGPITTKLMELFNEYEKNI
jgi:branched-chain amino acid aminotransferase